MGQMLQVADLAAFSDYESVSVEQSIRSTIIHKIDAEISQRKYDTELNLTGKQISQLPELEFNLKKLVCT